MRNCRFFLRVAVCLLSGWVVLGQLPPDAMDLSLLKIPEKVTSADFCPVHLVPSDKGLPIWIHKGVEYRGHAPDCQGAFEANPDELASSARYARWEKNFIDSMSIFWCPVTDEINPGGLLQWKRLGITWESCCSAAISNRRNRIFLDFRRPATGHANLVSGVGSAEMDRSSG